MYICEPNSVHNYRIVSRPILVLVPDDNFRKMGTRPKSRHVLSHSINLQLQQNILPVQNASYTVKNVRTDEEIFNITDTFFTLHSSKHLLDIHGRSIYQLKESIVSLHGRMHIIDSNTNKTVLTLRKKGLIPLLDIGTIIAWKGSSDNGKPDIICKGDFLIKEFEVRNGKGKILAKVKRKCMCLRNLVWEKNKYDIEIGENVNMALMILLVVAIDVEYMNSAHRSGFRAVSKQVNRFVS